MISLNRNVLVLNQSYEPVAVCNARKAIILVYLGKAEIVECLDFSVRSISFSMPFPSVVRLQIYFYRPFNRVIKSRKNILRRDGHTCQYCGKKNTTLTVDHVIPRHKGGSDNWDNLVCACQHCNLIKGNRSPEQAGMKLRKKPGKPSRLFFLQFYLETPHYTWRPYLFLN